MKQILLLIFTIFCINSFCQTTNDFEDFIVPSTGYLNGQDVQGEYVDQSISLLNNYEEFPNFVAWSGWAISSMTDSLTPGFSNQYSVISGTGYDFSSNYAVAYVTGESKIKLLGEAEGRPVRGFYINNSTYAYYSMLEGDSYAKRFGGESGNDPDFFLLTLKKYHEGELSADSINFYLADYRFDDNSLDYIIKDWEFVDLQALGNIDSLSFTLSSSDNGTFGMNTPAYFCIDNFTTKDLQTSINDIESVATLSAYPNPTSNILNVNLPLQGSYSLKIYNAQGQVLSVHNGNSKNISIDVSHLPNGGYFVTISSDKIHYKTRFTKS